MPVSPKLTRMSTIAAPGVRAVEVADVVPVGVPAGDGSVPFIQMSIVNGALKKLDVPSQKPVEPVPRTIGAMPFPSI